MLEFPFFELSDAEQAFPALRSYEVVLKACPPEFMEDPGKWGEAAFRLQTDGGWTAERQEKAIKLFITEDATIARSQYIYLTAWLNSFQPSHEQKMAVCGWLMSLMFRECPVW